jgi:hypothetical protein
MYDRGPSLANYVATSEAFYFRRYFHHNNASSPPGNTSIAAYGARFRILATTGSAFRIRGAVPCCASRLGVNTNHEMRVGVDSLADIVISS